METLIDGLPFLSISDNLFSTLTQAIRQFIREEILGTREIDVIVAGHVCLDIIPGFNPDHHYKVEEVFHLQSPYYLLFDTSIVP